MLLPYHIFVQTCLDLVGRRNILDIEHRLRLLPGLFLFQLLLVRDSAVPLQIRNIYKADIGEAVLLQVVQILLERRIIQHALIVKLAHRIHGFVHTVAAHTDIVRQLKHLPSLALRSAADKADILVLFFGLLLRFVLGFHLIYQIIISFILICHIFLHFCACLLCIASLCQVRADTKLVIAFTEHPAPSALLYRICLYDTSEVFLNKITYILKFYMRFENVFFLNQIKNLYFTF